MSDEIDVEMELEKNGFRCVAAAALTPLFLAERDRLMREEGMSRREAETRAAELVVAAWSRVVRALMPSPPSP